MSIVLYGLCGTKEPFGANAMPIGLHSHLVARTRIHYQQPETCSFPLPLRGGRVTRISLGTSNTLHVTFLRAPDVLTC